MAATRDEFRDYINTLIDNMPIEKFHCTDYMLSLDDKLKDLIKHIGYAEERACNIKEALDDMHNKR